MTVSRHPVHADVRTEEDRVESRPILVILFVTVAVGAALSWWAHGILVDRETVLRPSGVFDERTLQAPAEIARVEQTLIEGEPSIRTDRRQRERLDRYDWVNREGRIVSIPVERAMDLVIENARAGVPK